MIRKNFIRKLRRYGRRIFKFGTLAAVGLYFILSLVYTLPLNPVKIGLNPLIQTTVGTYFQQNWSLFAPNPVSSNLTLFIAPMDSTNVPDPENLPWADITTPLLERYQQNRFSGYERIGRAQVGALRLYLVNDPMAAPWKKACENGDSASCTIYEKLARHDKNLALQSLRRVGSSVCNQLFGPKQKYFALGYRLVGGVPWSQRYLQVERPTHFQLIGIFQNDPTITPAKFFNHD